MHVGARAPGVPRRESTLGSRPGSATRKSYRLGTDRVLAPEETLERVLPLMRGAGITRIANITGLDRIGIPVVTVVRPASRCLAVSQGKGVTLAAAKASGVMESLEWFMAEQRRIPAAFGSYAQLESGRGIVDPFDLLRFDKAVYAADRPLCWLEGHDLIADDPVLVPYDAVSLDFTRDAPHRARVFAAAGNGLAAGNHLLEAISHALCELVERDAAVLWQLRGSRAQQETRVRLDTIDDPVCCELLARFGAADVEVAVWDATSDVGLPCFICRVLDGESHFVRGLIPGDGCGCHLSRGIALARALTEAAQSRLTWIAGARDEFFQEAYEELRDPHLLERQRNFICATAGERRFPDAPDLASETFEADVARILERLVAAGFRRAVVVDLTGPPLDVPVVSAIVPGLEAGIEPEGFVRGPRAEAVVATTA